MRFLGRRLGIAVSLALIGAALPAQKVFSAPFSQTRPNGDYLETVATGGLRYQSGDFEIRAERALILTNREEARRAREQSGSGEGLPRRTVEAPDPRRSVTEKVLRQRLEDLLRAAREGREPSLPASAESAFPLGLVHSLYLEGDVVIVRGDLEVARADRAYLSLVEDRAVLHGVELRLRSKGAGGGERVLVVRGPELVRQGIRTTGRDVSLTTCSAGEPHFEVIAAQAEIIQRSDEFEVRVNQPHLAFSGTRVLPLPSMSFFTSDQSQIPIQGASGSFTDREGFRGQLDLGTSFNNLGGALHNAVTGRPREEFRGDWNLGLGWIETRGFPIEAGLTYRAGDLYRGRIRQFGMDDDGPNIREIQRQLDGSAIDNRGRRATHIENRVRLGDHTTLDLSLFHATDPAVWSEFFPREYREDEVPETSLHLRDGRENRLLTVTGRWNLASFSYADDRSLAPAFREEVPLATYDWFSEKIATLPGDTPLLLTSSTTAGLLRNEYDSRFAAPVKDETFRVTQELELAAPFTTGSIGIRPFATAQFAHYDNSTDGSSRDRWALAAGVSAGSRLSRTWSWDDGDSALRHVMSPIVSVLQRFQVDGDPGDYYQFDEIDTLDERTEIRFELLNRLQRRKRTSDGDKIDQFLWLDLAQTVTPISRDNADHHLGLFEFELIVRPLDEWVPLPNLQLLFEGEQDWNDDELRTLNTGVRFGRVLGLDWFGEYRTDRTTDGTIGYGISTSLLDRWGLSAGGQFDLQRDENLNYIAQVTRNDHDWRILFGVSFDLVTDTQNFFINFEPSLGGLIQPRRQRHITRQRLYGGGEFGEY